MLTSQGRQKLSQDQRKALQEARDTVLALYSGLPPQRVALTSQLQVCPTQTYHDAGWAIPTIALCEHMHMI